MTREDSGAPRPPLPASSFQALAAPAEGPSETLFDVGPQRLEDICTVDVQECPEPWCPEGYAAAQAVAGTFGLSVRKHLGIDPEVGGRSFFVVGAAHADTGICSARRTRRLGEAARGRECTGRGRLLASRLRPAALPREALPKYAC